jgi:hypothetical protein
MPVGDIIEARVITVQGPQMGVNVRHFRIDSVTGGEPSLSNIATQIEGAYAPGIRALMVSTATFRGVGARRIFPLPRSNEFISTASAGSGTVGGDALPFQTSGLITLRTALGSRRGRGRMYVAFPAEADNAGQGLPSSGYTANLAGLAIVVESSQTVTGTAGSLVIVPGIFHRIGAPNFDPLVAAIPRLAWATQRRRGTFGRPNTPPF